MLKGLRGLVLAAEAPLAGAGPWSAVWTFPSVLAAAFVISWAAEVAQFFMSQGLALAILAWLQTLPEFAVEADIAWRRNVGNMTANFTGSLRLLVGLGWPAIFVAAALAQRRQGGVWLREVVLESEHSVEVVSLLVPILYMLVVWWKGTLTVWDGAILIAIYGAYLYILNKIPAEAHEDASDLDAVPQAVMSLRPGVRAAAIVGMFLGGGLILYLTIHSFVSSLKALALSAGISEFVFIQWVAPFLSEFPEFLSAFKWAKTVRRAPMALMNLASSNINQWTVLVGMIPVVYSLSLGHVAGIEFDQNQRHEILLTILQSLWGMVLLVNMRYSAFEAATLFVLWFVQFVIPSLRIEVMWAYGALITVGVFQMRGGRRGVEAFSAFAHHFKTRVLAAAPES